jgi:hypothetical protein
VDDARGRSHVRFVNEPKAQRAGSRSRRNATRAAAACFLATLCSAARVEAQTCPVPNGASERLAAVPAPERLSFVRATMDEQARYTRIWKWAWVGIGSAAVVASTAVTIGFAAGNDPAREANIVDNAVAAAFSLATPIVTVVFAPRIEDETLEALLRATGGGAAGTCLVLARAEELLAKGAADEDLATGWLAHVVSILGAGALFAFMAIEAAATTDPPSRDAHWQNAAINGLAGVAYAEAQILTTPTGASRGYGRYLRGDLDGKSSVRVSVRPMGAGLALRLTF